MFYNCSITILYNYKRIDTGNIKTIKSWFVFVIHLLIDYCESIKGCYTIKNRFCQLLTDFLIRFCQTSQNFYKSL